jgi:Flp pilus assembly protein TadG
MQKKIPSRRRPHEQGQTIILVAISLVSLLAMAALAIDIVTLYSARSEIQRAADAAALAGAKAIADSSITTLQLGDDDFATVKPWAQSAAHAQINAVLQNNLVAGGAPTLVSFPVDWTRQGNPHITVNLQRTNLPTFFSKIWGGSAASVTATATAEAYNPGNVPNFIPIAPQAVKPWLVGNADPNSPTFPPARFINPANGTIESDVIGEQFYLKSDCDPAASPNCTSVGHPLVNNPPGVKNSANHLAVQYVPALVTPNSGSNLCPPSCAGATDYERSIECADMTTSYQVLSCGGGAVNAQWDNTVNPGGVGGLSDLGTECLIHAAGTGNAGQDILDKSPWPDNPMQIKAGSGSNAPNGSLVMTSSSIVTIPIIDTRAAIPASGGAVTIDGYMQAFIQQVHGGNNNNRKGDIEITVLNIAGCSTTPNAAPPVVGGSGTSPVPVRLIAPP